MKEKMYSPEDFVQIDEDAEYYNAYKTISFTDKEPSPELIASLKWLAIEAKIDYLIEHSDITFEELKMYVERKVIPFYIKEKQPKE